MASHRDRDRLGGNRRVGLVADFGSTKWFMSAEGYNHLVGFYESWPVMSHVPGYEGFTDTPIQWVRSTRLATTTRHCCPTSSSMTAADTRSTNVDEMTAAITPSLMRPISPL